MVEIDWKILLVQVVTFLVGMLLLWKPGFKYMAQILDQRKRQIQKDLEQASAAKHEMEQVKEDFEKQVSELRAKSQQRLDEALRDASRERDRLVEAAKKESKKIVDDAKQEIDRQTEQARKSLQDEAASLAILVAEKVIGEKMDDASNRKLVHGFIDELKGKN